MNVHNLFDKYTDNINSIDDSNIVENTGVNYDNIKNKVFAEIGNKKPHKKHRKVFVALVAAIILTAMICTTGYATGNFSDVFGYLFSGDCVDNFYSGGNIEVTAEGDDSLNLEVIGITGGNEYEVCIAYKITKKDGSEFVSNINDYYPNFNNSSFSVSEPFDTFISDGWSGFNEGYFEDTRTIILYQTVQRDKAKLIGQKFTAEYSNLCIHHEGQNSEIRKTVEYDVTFNVSLDLNYKPNSAACTPDKNTISNFKYEDEGFNINIDSVIISQFSMKIYGDYSCLDANNDSNSDNINPLPSNGTVTMNSGEVYKLTEDSSFNNNNIEFCTNYIFENSKYNGKMCIIDYNDIKEIKIGDITFTVNK